MQHSYNQAEQYKNGNKLGNPDQAGNKVIFDKNANVSNLGNMCDKDLTSMGSQTLSNSFEEGLLNQSEMRKIDALKEYDFSPNSPLIKDSMKIESDPLKHT